MTKEEKIICKEFLNDADNTHSCNEYKLLMNLLEQETVSRESYNHEYFLRKELDLKVIRLERQIAEQELCEDCISRQAVLDLVNSDWEYEELGVPINCLPPVTPTRKKGKWIIDDEELGRIWHCHCSNCKKDPQDYIGGTENWWLVRLPDYCPNCGIKMESEEE